jgi:HAD superfamily hydrolase (TIGR01549 family)
MATAVRAVLCDLDDTLFDHAHATRMALAGVQADEPALGCWEPAELERRHAEILELMHQEVLAGRLLIERARAERFRRLLFDADRTGAASARAPELAARYRSGYERAWRAVPGALDLAAAIRRAGLPIAVVTNNILSEQRAKMAICGLDAYVDALITSEEIGVTKPDVRIFEAALSRCGAQPHEAVMIGDAWHTDILGARAAGIRPIWLNRLATPSPDPSVAELRALDPWHDAWRVITSA